MNASDILKQISKKESDLEFYNSVLSKYEDLCISYELSQMNQKVEDESIEILDDFSKILDQLEVKETLNQKDDFRDAIIQIHPGAGGLNHKIGLVCCIECIQNGFLIIIILQN